VSLSLLIKSAAAYLAFALIAFAASPAGGAEMLFKLLAVAFAASILTPLVYPSLRGVRKGDEISVEFSGRRQLPGVLNFFFRADRGIAMGNGRVGGRLDVLMGNGALVPCVIRSYEGFFRPAQATAIEGMAISPDVVSIV